MLRSQQRFLVRIAAPVLGASFAWLFVYAGTSLGFEDKVRTYAQREDIDQNKAEPILRGNQLQATNLAALFGAVVGIGAGVSLTLRPVHDRWASYLESHDLLRDEPNPP